jgi:hypothetical protein
MNNTITTQNEELDNYLNSINSIKGISKILRGSLLITISDAIEKAKIKRMDGKARMVLLEQLLDLKRAIEKSTQSIEQQTLILLEVPKNVQL